MTFSSALLPSEVLSYGAWQAPALSQQYRTLVKQAVRLQARGQTLAR